MQAIEVVKPLRLVPGGDVLDSRACNWGASLARGHNGRERSPVEDANGTLNLATAAMVTR